MPKRYWYCKNNCFCRSIVCVC